MSPTPTDTRPTPTPTVQSTEGLLRELRDFIAACDHGEILWLLPGWRDDIVARIEAALSASPQSEGLREALTPSGDTKAAYHGEFYIDVPLDGYDEEGEQLEGTKRVPVPWDTVKEIMAAIRARAALSSVDAPPTEREKLGELRRAISTAVVEMAALIPDPSAPIATAWPCTNEADRACLQRAYTTLRDVLTPGSESHER